MTEADIKPRIPVPAPPPEEEHLRINVPGEGGAIWAVRIPRFLYDKWSRVDEGGVHLGTLVIDSSANPPNISLKIPEQDIKPDTSEVLRSIGGNGNANAEAGPSREIKPPRPTVPISSYDTTGLPPVYDLHVPEERAKNTWVFSETIRAVNGLKFDGSMLGKRKREKANPTLLGPVQHDCTLNPILDAQYMTIMNQRRLEGEHARRPIIRLESVETNRGKLNQMSGGWTTATSRMGKSMITNSSRLPSADKATRLPRTTLRNHLFDLFRRKPYWGIGALKETTKQPDGWLREVLRDVASQVQEGPYRNLFELRADWRDIGTKVEGAETVEVGEEGSEGEGGDGEEDEDWDEDEDEDEDFEEVM